MEDRYGIGVDIGEGKDWFSICRMSLRELEESLKRICKSMDDFYAVMDKIQALKVSGKCRKTTYKTIRRDCAKRNRCK